jgi:hypothetical protein
MNEPNNPASPHNTGSPASAAGVPPLPPPLDGDASPTTTLEALLKRPVQMISLLHTAPSTRLPLTLFATATVVLMLYGVIVGSFSGGMQLFAAPVKISLGALASIFICLPSFFIFASLSGADVTLRSALGILGATLALTAVLLIGFAPVAWVFAQSTESVALIGALHLIFWLIAVAFGLRLLRLFMNMARVTDRMHLKVWAIIFLMVTLQMTTSLRPIIGKAPTILPTEKKFFLEHWTETLSADTANTPPPAAAPAQQ